MDGEHCPHCGGVGEIKDGLHDGRPCPVCKGSGRVHPLVYSLDEARPPRDPAFAQEGQACGDHCGWCGRCT